MTSLFNNICSTCACLRLVPKTCCTMITSNRGLGVVPCTTRLERPPLRPRLVRHSAELVPPTQYDGPARTDRFTFPNVLIIYWELLPCFAVTAIAMMYVVLATFWACRNKVDVSFTRKYYSDSISRSMDLRNPSNHKIITINQKYEPWEEMQAVLDKMKFEEKQQKNRLRKCVPQPAPVKKMACADCPTEYKPPEPPKFL